MRLPDFITTWLRERDMRRRLRSPYVPGSNVAAELQPISSLAEFGERLGEQLRLAKKLADDSARSDVETYCTYQRMGRLTWYDTHSLSKEGVFVGEDVTDQVRYLDLRGRLIRHPVQRHLVRFER